MNDYVKLKDLADDRGESSAKVARTLVRLGCDLYLHIGPSRKSRSGMSFIMNILLNEGNTISVQETTS